MTKGQLLDVYAYLLVLYISVQIKAHNNLLIAFKEKSIFFSCLEKARVGLEIKKYNK